MKIPLSTNVITVTTHALTAHQAMTVYPAVEIKTIGSCSEIVHASVKKDTSKLINRPDADHAKTLCPTAKTASSTKLTIQLIQDQSNTGACSVLRTVSWRELIVCRW